MMIRIFPMGRFWDDGLTHVKLSFSRSNQQIYTLLGINGIPWGYITSHPFKTIPWGYTLFQKLVISNRGVWSKGGILGVPGMGFWWWLLSNYGVEPLSASGKHTKNDGKSWKITIFNSYINIINCKLPWLQVRKLLVITREIAMASIPEGKWCKNHRNQTGCDFGAATSNGAASGRAAGCDVFVVRFFPFGFERMVQRMIHMLSITHRIHGAAIQGGATSTTLAHAAESGPFSVPHECLRWATNLSCRNGSNKAERYMQKAPAETKAMKCNQRQRERSHTIILPHAPLNQCCFSQTGDLLASKYSTASLPRIQVQWNNQLWFRGEGFLYGAGYFLCCREKHAKRMDQGHRLL